MKLFKVVLKANDGIVTMAKYNWEAKETPKMIKYGNGFTGQLKKEFLDISIRATYTDDFAIFTLDESKMPELIQVAKAQMIARRERENEADMKVIARRNREIEAIKYGEIEVKEF